MTTATKNGIVRRLNQMWDRHDHDAWELGAEVIKACMPTTRGFGAPGVRTGVEARIAELAASTRWSPHVLNSARKVYMAYWDEATQTLNTVPGVSHTVHRIVMGRDDKRELLARLVEMTGDPVKVTKTMVRNEIERRVDAAVAEQYGDERRDFVGPLVRTMLDAEAALNAAQEAVAEWVDSGTSAQGDELPKLIAGAHSLVTHAALLHQSLSVAQATIVRALPPGS